MGDPVVEFCKDLAVREGLAAVDPSLHQLSSSRKQAFLNEKSGVL